MLDFTEMLEASQNDAMDQVISNSVFFYQTAECKDIINSAYQFEGSDNLQIIEHTDANIIQYANKPEIKLVLVELNQSELLYDDAERLRRLIPNYISVVIIGKLDSIVIVRQLKEMGFYYLYWPATKEDVIDFVHHVNINVNKKQWISKERHGKRISVVGCKGGIGSTFICAEIAYLLANEKKSSCVVVDNHNTVGNIDIMMGIKKFQRRSLQKGALIENLDLASAKSLLVSLENRLSVLSITSETHLTEQIQEYTDAVVDVIATDVNFMIEDHSSASHLDSSKFLRDSDVVIFILDPSVSSIRDFAYLQSKIKQLANTLKLRTFVVLNHHVPIKYATVTRDEIEKIIERKVDVEIPFDGKIPKLKLNGKNIFTSKSLSAKALRQLVDLILGEEKTQSKFSLSSMFSSKVK